MTDQDRISPYNIYTISNRQVMRGKKISIRGFYLIQYQILRTYIKRNIWKAVRRITNEILGVEGLKMFEFLS